MATGRLAVHVLSARNLRAADSNGKSDPYVKVAIVNASNKRVVQRTATVMETLNPSFSETLIFDDIARNAIIEIKVRDFDKFSRDDPLGHVRSSLQQWCADEDSFCSEPRWLSLEESGSDTAQIQLRIDFLADCSHMHHVEGDTSFVANHGGTAGSGVFAKLRSAREPLDDALRRLRKESATPAATNFRFDALTATLAVRIIKARNLRAGDVGGTSDPFCELRLRGGTEEKVHKTRVIKRTLDPNWTHCEEEVVWHEVRLHETLRLRLLDRDRFIRDDVLGHVDIDLVDWLAITGADDDIKMVINGFPSHARRFSAFHDTRWYALSTQGEVEVSIRMQLSESTRALSQWSCLVNQGLQVRNFLASVACRPSLALARDVHERSLHNLIMLQRMVDMRFDVDQERPHDAACGRLRIYVQSLHFSDMSQSPKMTSMSHSAPAGGTATPSTAAPEQNVPALVPEISIDSARLDSRHLVRRREDYLHQDDAHRLRRLLRRTRRAHGLHSNTQVSVSAHMESASRVVVFRSSSDACRLFGDTTTLSASVDTRCSFSPVSMDRPIMLAVKTASDTGDRVVGVAVSLHDIKCVIYTECAV
ncbi:MAG: hypothetical protein MHM6MM_002533 [Cercozoa sp. M6MM]